MPLSPLHPMRSADEWPALRDHVAVTNIQRMWWLLLTSSALSITLGIINFSQIRNATFAPWQALDIIGSAIFFVLFWLARKGRIPPRTSWWLSPAYFAFWLVLMDGYYFCSLPIFGENAAYALGVVTPSILILLPPRISLSLLIPNHLIFCAILSLTAAAEGWSAEAFGASLTTGTLGVIVASLGGWFLFAAHKSSLHNERLLKHRTAEARLNASHLRAILDNIPFQAWLKDTHGNFLAVNGEFAAVNGLTKQEISGRHLRDIYPRDRAAQYHAEDARVMQSGQRAYLEQNLETPDGTIWYEVFKSPVTDDDGITLGTVGLARDITQRKVLEERLLDADRAKSEFLATMSHEIRTPMNIVLGYANILRETALDPVQEEHVDTIIHSGQLLLTIINDILDFSKIEAGKLSLQPEPFEIRQLTARLVRMFQPPAGQKGLELRGWVDDDVPPVITADHRRIEQILVNLLSNAVKFTDQGFVHVRISSRPSATEPGQSLIICRVTDSGIGIAPDQLKSLFQPFTQADTTMARRYTGTGLGLVIVQKLCGLMGGSITVKSAPGKGSVFRASFAADVSSSRPVGKDASDNPGGTETDYSSARVLIVEDNSSNRKLITILLKRWGITPTVAENGGEAVQLVQGVDYDIILMDVQMPGMDGFEATRRIRQWEAGRNPPRRCQIVALTALVMPDDRDRCLQAGMDDYLSKPIKPESLLRAIQSAAAKRQRKPIGGA